VCNGTAVPVGTPSVAADQRTLTISVPNPLPRGSCELNWIVSAVTGGTTDGAGKLTFSISADTAATTAITIAPSTVPGVATGTPITAAPPTDTPSSRQATAANESGGPAGMARLAATLGLAVLFGALVVIALAWPEGVEYVLTVRFLRSAWIVGLVGAYAHAVALTTLGTSRTFGSAIVPTAWIDIADTAAGMAAIVRVIAAAACGWVALRPERVIDQVTQLAALGVPGIAVATFAFSRSDAPYPLLGYMAGLVHVIAMAVWTGGLVLLARVVLAGPGEEDLVHAVRGYSRLSTAAIIATVGSGAAQLFRLDRGALASSGHGRVVLLKAIIVAGVVFIGTKVRQVIRDKLSRADSLGPKMAARLRRSLGVEALACVVTLALSAWLLALPPATVRGDAPGNLGSKQVFKSLDESVEITVAFTQRVGPNAVRVELIRPATGLSNVSVTFQPEEPGGTTVQFLAPDFTEPGAVYLPLSADAMPLNVAGRWTITVQVGQSTIASKSVTVSGDSAVLANNSNPVNSPGNSTGSSSG
jgi:copper transport protein